MYLLFKCSGASYHNNFSLLHRQEVFSSCISSLASITMADHQEYSFTQFPSIRMVSSFFNCYESLLNWFVFLVYICNI